MMMKKLKSIKDNFENFFVTKNTTLKKQDQDDLQDRKQESFLATLIIFDRHFKHS